MHTPIEVNAVAGSKECRVKTRKRAFSHISMSYIDIYITKTTNKLIISFTLSISEYSTI